MSSQTVAVGDGAPSIADRRRSPRRAVSHRGRLTRAAGVAPEEVNVVDISDHGMAIVAPAPLEAGASVQIVVLRDEGFNLKANLRIVRCRPLDNGAYRIGAEIE